MSFHYRQQNGQQHLAKRTSEEKMKQFESMLRHMISHIINENEKISEERICEAVSTRLMKEMDYIMREKEEVQDKQTALLQQILEEVKREIPETAASDEVKPTEARRKKKNENKAKRRKLFAKSV